MRKQWGKTSATREIDNTEICNSQVNIVKKSANLLQHFSSVFNFAQKHILDKINVPKIQQTKISQDKYST